MPGSQELARVLLALTQSEKSQEKIEAFFTYLQEKNLSGLLPQIREHVVRITERADDFNTLTVSSRYELSEAEIKTITQIVGAHAGVSIKKELREDVVGSFSATYRGTMYDGSLKFALSEMNKALQL